ncbi:MAG: hypothetical protein WAP57_12055 [Aquabacterium commune]|uniref:hypothetical protein n=1 Tax=Aquabacterium commune TaxID=70586 RepID=UPI003BAE8AA9
MLINDDSKGTSDGKEKDQLQAMIAVGSEFITYRDAESTVQKSGEFVRIEKEPSEGRPRFVLLHETSKTYDENWTGLTGSELRNTNPNVKLRKRTRLYVADVDPSDGDSPFRQIGAFRTNTRISRYHGRIDESRPIAQPAMYEANYTAQAGKRRLFSVGDGRVLLVREVNRPDDARHFVDSRRDLTEDGYTKARGLRAAVIEVVEIDAVTGKDKAAIFSFPVHSGLGLDPTNKMFSVSIRTTTADMTDDDRVFGAFSGVMWGSSLFDESTGTVPIGGDASDTYAVCEPSIAKWADGRDYVSIIAVYPAPDDVYDSRSAGPYRLTCKFTRPGGQVAVGKVSFPPLTSNPLHYFAVRGVSLHRLSPTRVVLRVLVHAMQFGVGGTVPPSSSDTLWFWSEDNGENWARKTYAVGFPGLMPYGGVMAESTGSLLVFSWFRNFNSVATVEVHRFTAAGTALVGSIPAATFNGGLLASNRQLSTAYQPLGFGGAVYRKTQEGPKKRMWMQFDPYWAYEQGHPFALTYPTSRPMLLVSDNGGVTWVRRFLPAEWSFTVGFVVSVDKFTLAVPVHARRKLKGDPLPTTIYISKDGGDTWKPTGLKITLSGDTFVDGNKSIGATYEDSRGAIKFEQDMNDSATEYNRGELLPMVTLCDADGKLLPSNPARPWMADYRFKEPTYG